MIIKQFITILVFLLLVGNNKVIALEHKTPPEGFLWYNEKPLIHYNSTATQNNSVDKPIHHKVNDWDKRLDDLKRQIENAARKAIDNPTLVNVLHAQKLHKVLLDKADRFAVMWQLAALIDSELVNLEEPSNSMQKKLQEQKIAKINSAKLKKITKQWGLILQFDERCPACHAFAPIVREFADIYGFQVLAVSQTGKDFLGIQGGIDTGLFMHYNLNPGQIVPVLYLISSSGDNIYPISRGISSPAKIVENIIAIDTNYQRLIK